MRRMYSKNQIENIAKDVALPEIESSDAGKVLTVNEGGTEAVWAEASGGGKLYEHNVTIYMYKSGIGEIGSIFVKLVTNDNAAYTTRSEFVAAVYNAGYTSGSTKELQLTGYRLGYSNNTYNASYGFINYIGCYTSSTNSSDFHYVYTQIKISNGTITTEAGNIQGWFHSENEHIRDYVREL